MHTAVASVLIDIESALRQLALWEAAPPSPAALASEQPFAMDTLSLPQWLQFVFLPRMYQLLESGEPLPARCAIAPMAEEHFLGSELLTTGLMDALETMDELLSETSPGYTVAPASPESA